MQKLQRRRFLRLLAGSLIIAALPPLVGCQGISPEPFVTGRTVPAPLGCSELLSRDRRGDC